MKNISNHVSERSERAGGFLAFFLCLAIICASMPISGLLAAESVRPEYKLGPEDILEIYVDRHTDLSRVVVVGPDGKISLPLIGDVKAQGLTRTELQQEIAGRFKSYITEPMVTVLIQSFNSFKVYVLGQVNRPGLYSLKGKPYLMEAISLASGLTDDANSEEVVIKRDTERIVVNLSSFLKGDGDNRDILLQTGDTVFVPKLELEKKVFVLGEVGLPGAYDLKQTVSLIEALSLAGSYKPTANLTDVTVERRGDGKKVLYHVNLDRLINSGDMSQNMTIVPGDTIFVPRGNSSKIMVLGQVLTPGVYEHHKGMTILEGVTLAGSHTTRAVLEKAAIIRGHGDSRQVMQVNLSRVIHEGRLSENLDLLAGDVVYIPETLEPDWAKNILPMLESIQIGRDLVKNW
ncbi:MAG: hypothetical protein CVV64_02255 [Candidatus Wallbacteria bacterium HGW-Wallbacteria-1]|jgi:polysaccharide export outer membrane protein|uniref:Soluble ligand binding domain-containing protein n=1 Tax=Candidatus Wallbacteria bacterium HGW-Wallbacteria-1 TaxID=2013854 RepID=A0A2N1PV87_9BACT|nr:MAG: hypothetical protein CVV64_02255 [Candidatus Wallbacteria bacterium HGW-Wallbacteria-1]